LRFNKIQLPICAKTDVSTLLKSAFTREYFNLLDQYHFDVC